MPQGTMALQEVNGCSQRGATRSSGLQSAVRGSQHGGREVTVGSLFHLKSPAGDFSEWPVGDRRPGDRRPGHLGVTRGGGAPGGGSSRGDPEVTWGGSRGNVTVPSGRRVTLGLDHPPVA